MHKRKKNDKPVVTTKHFKDFISGNIYEVKPERIREYGFYSNRYTVPIMLGILLNNFKMGNAVTILITLGLIVLLEYRYRRKFLPSLNVRNHVNIEKTVGKDALVMNSILYIVLGVLLLIYGLTGDVGDSMKWILIALAVGSGGISFMYIGELFAIKK